MVVLLQQTRHVEKYFYIHRANAKSGTQLTCCCDGAEVSASPLAAFSLAKNFAFRGSAFIPTERTPGHTQQK